VWDAAQEIEGFRLQSVQFVVFDEADRLFEMGFADQLRAIMKEVPTYPLPARSHCPCRAAASERGPGGLTRELETPLPSDSPHDHMILRVDLVDSHGRWKGPCLQTAHMTI
jgi:hypothetical protein